MNGQPTNPYIIAVIVTLGAFMEVLDTTIVNVALPHIAGSLSVSDDDRTWSLTTYLVANGIVLTISGGLARRFGQKKFFLICISVFTLASLGCGLSTAFPELLLFRTIQGLFGGGLQPTQQAIILATFPPERRQQAFSITAIATIIAPVLGPLLGGWITDNYSWHLIFLINVPIGIMTLLGVMHFVQEPPDAAEQKRTAPPFDFVGTIFIALALGCLELGIDRGEDLDWFWRGWYMNNWRFDMAVTGIADKSVTIQNKGQLVLPATLEVMYSDGTKTRIRVPVETWESKGELTWVGEKAIASATIDPDHVLPDDDRTNNTFNAK